MKKWIALLLAVCMLFSFGGCREKTTTNKFFKYPVDTDPACLDPQIAVHSSALLTISSSMEGLVRQQEDGSIAPGVARKWEISENYLEYTFYLREDANWLVPKSIRKLVGESFDNALTANDFVFALTRAVDPATNAPDARKLYAIRNAKEIHAGRKNISALGVKAVDRYTLKITLDYPEPDLLHTLTSAVAMPCNEEFFLFTAGRYGLDSTMILSNGPFYISKWTQDTSLLLRRNDEYKGDNIAVPSSLSLYVNTDEQKQLDNLLESVYDAIPVSEKNLDKIKQDGIGLYSYADTTWILGFNNLVPALASKNIRIALAAAIEQDDLATQGYALSAEGLVPPTLNVGEKTYREAVGKASRISFDKIRAQQALEAGLTELEQTKIPSLTLICPDEIEIRRMMGYIIQYWQKNLNLYINLEAVPLEELQARLRSGDYQIAYYPMAADTDYLTDYYRCFTGGDAKNVLGYDSAEFNAIVEKMETNTDSGQRQQMFEEAENYLLQNAVVYPVAFQKTYYATAKGVANVYFHSYGGNVSFFKAEKSE